MPDETKKSTKKPGGWSAARKHLSAWDKPALLALVKDLYDSAAGNRDFIHARCQAEDGGGEVLETYRSKIVEQFFPKRGFGKLKLGEARKAIRDYRKATGNIPGTAELLMSYVESGEIWPVIMAGAECGMANLFSFVIGTSRRVLPDLREDAVKTELAQADLLCGEWVGSPCGLREVSRLRGCRGFAFLGSWTP